LRRSPLGAAESVGLSCGNGSFWSGSVAGLGWVGAGAGLAGTVFLGSGLIGAVGIAVTGFGLAAAMGLATAGRTVFIWTGFMDGWIGAVGAGLVSFAIGFAATGCVAHGLAFLGA